ncbi:MAG TPA: type II toxin-antitoxin system HicA family toxin [Candidatus Thermoplasmatota archaeon]|nr:type II toxin-antitoxin system HicA family toxin [Candidatus Thermoplasmatota archaeon]
MGKLPALSARKVLKALGQAGFEIVGQRGSHVRLNGRRGGEVRVVIVPNHRSIAPGTLVSILRQAGMTRAEFDELLK